MNNEKTLPSISSNVKLHLRRAAIFAPALILCVGIGYGIAYVKGLKPAPKTEEVMLDCNALADGGWDGELEQWQETVNECLAVRRQVRAWQKKYTEIGIEYAPMTIGAKKNDTKSN